jgi:hypothetical protein
MPDCLAVGGVLSGGCSLAAPANVHRCADVPRALTLEMARTRPARRAGRPCDPGQ